jgi:hypothetical protein
VTNYPTFPPGHSRRTPFPPRQFAHCRNFNPKLARAAGKIPMAN